MGSQATSLPWPRRRSGYPHVIAEIGGIGKRLGAAFAKLHDGGPLPPGFIALVGRVVRRRWFWYTRQVSVTRHLLLRSTPRARYKFFTPTLGGSS
ncbi:MAG TPA: hypothetical protein VIX83_03220 [Candidatus Cybelea sp.]